MPQNATPKEPSAPSTIPTTSTTSRLTVGFLVPRTRTWTTELLGLAPPVISNQQCPVVLYQRLLQLVLRVLINVLLVVCDL